MTLVVRLELWISPQICKKKWNNFNGILRGLGETDSWKSLKLKISWHYPFKKKLAGKPHLHEEINETFIDFGNIWLYSTVCAEYVVGERDSSLEESRFSHEVENWFCLMTPLYRWEVMSFCIKTCDIIFTVCILLLTSMILATPKQSLAKRINVKEVCSSTIYRQSIKFKKILICLNQYFPPMLLKKLPIL
jgi:hypothetical protein